MGPKLWETLGDGPAKPAVPPAGPASLLKSVGPGPGATPGNGAADLAATMWGLGAAGVQHDASTGPGSTMKDDRQLDPTDPEAFNKRLMDRMAVMQELKSKFVIEDDPAKRLGEQNSVSTEEFQRIAALYSDIRLGNTNIKFSEAMKGADGKDTEAFDAYKGAAMGDMAMLLQTKSGRMLLEQLASAKDEDGNAKVTELGQMKPGEDGKLGPHTDPGAKGAYVGYLPGQLNDVGNTGAPEGNMVRSDVVLYHELLHSLHVGQGHAPHGAGELAAEEVATTGLSRPTKFDDLKNYFNENRYRHERSVIGESAERGGAGAYEGDWVEGQGLVGADKGMQQRTRYGTQTGPGAFSEERLRKSKSEIVE